MFLFKTALTFAEYFFYNFSIPRVEILFDFPFIIYFRCRCLCSHIRKEFTVISFMELELRRRHRM